MQDRDAEITRPSGPVARVAVFCRRSIRGVACVGALLALAPRAANAEPCEAVVLDAASGPSPEQRVTPAPASHRRSPVPPDALGALARGRAQRARLAETRGQLASALQLYGESFLMVPAFRTAANLGLLEARLNHWNAAAYHLQRALDVMPRVDSGTQVAVKRVHAEVRRRVIQLDFQTQPPAADIVIDGKRFVGAGSHSAYPYVVPGKYEIVVRYPGCLAAKRTLVVSAGERGKTRAVLVELQTDPKIAASREQIAHGANPARAGKPATQRAK